jgi:XTP/dITP diphosphohydrolase
VGSAVRRLNLLVATTNIGKFRELCTLLGDLPLDLQSLADCAGAPEVAEDGATYAANALLKAETIARWSGRATLADDSGLEVDALGGEPGARSARYAGAAQDSRANVRKLLDGLAGVAPAQRTARFRCVIVVACPDGATLAAEGTYDGRIIDTPRGHEGFGYDPVFLDPASGLTFAEMPAVIKNRISHRARACARLREQLMPFLSAHAHP